MNIFKSDIEAIESVRAEKEKWMADMSQQLLAAMGLTRDDLIAAAECELSWMVAGYCIATRNFPWNNWEHLLVVTPDGADPAKCGYSNTPDSAVATESDGWEINDRGTATTWTCTEKESKKIFRAIKAYRDYNK